MTSVSRRTLWFAVVARKTARGSGVCAALSERGLRGPVSVYACDALYMASGISWTAAPRAHTTAPVVFILPRPLFCAAFGSRSRRVDVKTKVAHQHGPLMYAIRARPHASTESTTHIKPGSVRIARYTPGSEFPATLRRAACPRASFSFGL